MQQFTSLVLSCSEQSNLILMCFALLIGQMTFENDSLSPSCNFFPSPFLSSKNLSLSNRGFYMVEADAHQFLSPCFLSAQSLTFPFVFVLFFMLLLQVINHTIILQRGEELHTFSFLITNVPHCHTSTSALGFTLRVHSFTPSLHQYLLPTPTKSVAVWRRLASLFPVLYRFFVYGSSCSHHETSSILHPRLSICALHLCRFRCSC